MANIRIDLPPEAVALYESGAGIAMVAATFGCSYEGARSALLRARVELRKPQPLKPRIPLVMVVRCHDCGERLDRPHPLGAHLPGCEAAL